MTYFSASWPRCLTDFGRSWWPRWRAGGERGSTESCFSIKNRPSAPFFCPERTWRAVQRRAPDHRPEGRRPARPHEFTCVGPRGPSELGKGGGRLTPEPSATAATRSPRSPSRDTATGTSPTWPPAPSCDGHPQQLGDFSCCSATRQVRPLRVTPFQGASQGWCPQARHHLRLARPQGP